MAGLEPERVKAALTELISDIDYDLYMSWVVDETDGKDYFHILVESFIESYND